MVDGGTLVFLDDQIFESLRSWNIMVLPQNTDSHPCTLAAAPRKGCLLFRESCRAIRTSYRKSRKMPDLGSGAPFSFFSASFWLVTFRFHFERNRTSFIFIVFGPSGRDMTMTPKNNYSWLWRHHDTGTNSRRNLESFWKIWFLKYVLSI